MKKSIKYTATTLLGFFVLTTGYFWVTFASPFGYDPPANLPVINDQENYTIFVYGTLTKPWVRWLVMGRVGSSKPAILKGFRKEGLDIKEDASSAVKGQVINVNADELRALDRYERLGVRYERKKLRLNDGTFAWVYRLINPS